MNRILFTFCLLLTLGTAWPQVSQVEFGKNRIQYHDDFAQWMSYESQNFITYWYGRSKNTGTKAAQIAESMYEDIISTIEFRINDKIELIVYSDITDMKQSNIGSEEVLRGRAGHTTIERNKIFIYFDGDHRNLRLQIREGVAGVFINYMLFGSELQEMVQNIMALGLPDWFYDGLIGFVGQHWSVEEDDLLRDALSSRVYKNFDRFARDYPRISGHAFWFYVSLTYGKAEIGNLLYYIRINRNIDNAFKYVFGQTYKEVLNATWSFMQQLNANELPLVEPFIELPRLPVKNRRKIPYTQVKINPTLPLIVYSTNEMGRIKVFLYNLEDNSRKRILRSGYKNTLQETDYNYPILAWNENGNLLAIMYESRDKIYLQLTNMQTGEKLKQLIPNRYQRIYAMDFWDDNTLVFSASENSFNDLYLYRIRNRTSSQLTNDVYDDLHVATGFWGGKKGIFFSSNRTQLQYDKISSDTIVPLSDMNLYFFDPDTEADTVLPVLIQKNADLTNVRYSSDGSIHFLSNETGIINRKTLHQGASEAVFYTNYPRNIENFDIHYNRDLVAEIVKFQTKPSIIVQSYSARNEAFPNNTSFYQGYRTTPGKRPTTGTTLKGFPTRTAPLKPVRRDTLRESNPDYFFQSPFEDMKADEDVPQLIPEFTISDIEVAKEKAPTELSPSEYERINPMRVTPYRLRFRIDFVNTTMDNNPLFEGLESYAGTGEVTFNNPMGLLFKVNIKDLFEDYQIEGGIRIPTTFNGAEYFLLFDDKKTRLNKRYALYRRANYNNEGFIGNITLRNKQEILLGQYQLRYPLDVFTSIRGIATLRQDRFTRLATEPGSLLDPPVVEQRAGIRLEYVFDNTMPIDLNILHGSRYKFYIETVKRFQIQVLDGFKFDLADGFMNIIGFDARHYIPLLKHMIFAVRAAGATTFGSEKILYFLGGTDQTIIPRFNENIPLPAGENFAYQTLAPNVRGFDFGIRNGNSFALVNAEIRIPVFKYLYGRPIRSNFLRNFQVVGFADAGTAWQGVSPFNRENPLNTIELESPPTIRIKVNYFRDPIVMGYGVGLRTMLFGYFLRLDYGWGIETKQLLRPKFHLAMGMDF